MSEVEVDELAALAAAQKRQRTLAEKRAMAEAKIKEARIQYLESELRTGELQLTRMVIRETERLARLRMALVMLKAEPVPVNPVPVQLADGLVASSSDGSSVATSTHGEIERGHIDGQQEPALV